jgi:transcription elongation GreA/GreB family factor
MTSEVVEQPAWPITAVAHGRLVDELSRLRHEVANMVNQIPEESVVHVSAAHAARRFATLALLADNMILSDAHSVAIGRRVVLHDADGQAMQFSIVFPGDGDPVQGWISADSPLGAALLGSKPGATVEVDAPIGSWKAIVVSVE